MSSSARPINSPVETEDAIALLPLNDVRVLDLTTTLAGPAATRHLADFGADVIKLESKHHLDSARLGHPYAGGGIDPDRSGYFAAYNTDKRSFALNLRAARAPEILGRLVSVSDVVVESFRPGVMARLGLTYEVMRGWNSRIIMASHSLQGQTGPHAAQRGYGQLSAAIAGWTDLTGAPDRAPVGPFSAYTDFIAAPVLLSAVLLALEHRDATGEGMYIDQAHLESSAYFSAPELVAAQLGSAPVRNGNRVSFACPNNTYPCRGDDRWCAVTVSCEEEWIRFCRVLEAPALATDARFRTHEERKRHEDELDAEIARQTVLWNVHALADALSAAGVPGAVVYRAEDLFADAQLAHRGVLRAVVRDDHDEHVVLEPAFQIRGVATARRRPWPLIGEHTIEICRDVLGLTSDEIASYAEDGVFE